MTKGKTEMQKRIEHVVTNGRGYMLSRGVEEEYDQLDVESDRGRSLDKIPYLESATGIEYDNIKSRIYLKSGFYLIDPLREQLNVKVTTKEERDRELLRAYSKLIVDEKSNSRTYSEFVFNEDIDKSSKGEK